MLLIGTRSSNRAIGIFTSSGVGIGPRLGKDWETIIFICMRTRAARCSLLSCTPGPVLLTFSHHLLRHDFDRRASLGVDRPIQVPSRGPAFHLRAWATTRRPDPEIRWAGRLADRDRLALARHDGAAHVGRGGGRYPVPDSAQPTCTI